MNLEQLSYLAQIVGSIAVVFSLIYVALQLKQNNSMAKSAAQQALSAQINEWNLSIATNSCMAETMAKVHLHNLVRESATDVERIQIAYVYAGIFNQMRLAYQQYREGVFTLDELNELFGSSHAVLTKPYLKSIWHILRPEYSVEYVKWCEEKYDLNSGSASGQ